MGYSKELDTYIKQEKKDQKLQIEQKSRRMFDTVTNLYQEISELSPLSAAVINPNAIPKRLDFRAVDFLCDVEMKTRQVLSTKEFDQWRKYVSADGDYSLSLGQIATLSNKLGPVYQRYNLGRGYFRAMRQRLPRIERKWA